MEEFAWATNNLDAGTPQELQEWGVNVFFAPQISLSTRVVNLANGLVTEFRKEQDRPTSGYYADYDGLARYCVRQGIPFSDYEGQASVLPSGKGKAGDPLLHGEAQPIMPNAEALAAQPMGNHPQPDPGGERGGDTGPTEHLGYGAQAERGDQHREYRGSEPQTRGGKGGVAGGQGGGRSGSQHHAGE
ncbi:MAG TPA: hypothetical protein VIL85_06205 [Thermomicrobiales bacterium]